MRNEQEIDRLFHQTLVSTITVKFSVGPGAHQVLLQKTELSVCVGSTHTKIGTLQRLAWPLPKDDTQIHEAFPFFFFFKRKQSWRWIDYGHPSAPHQGCGGAAEMSEVGLQER